MPRTIRPIQERLARRTQKTEDCWLWIGTTGRYYGQIRQGGYGTPMVYVHRVAYELTYGPIPEGYEVDHLCRIPTCVRPDHLEAVTPQENHRRRIGFRRNPRYLGETCKAGHSRIENTRINKTGARYCRLCANEAVRRSYTAHRGGVPSLTIQ